MGLIFFIYKYFFCVLPNGYSNNKFKQEVWEVWFIKELSPSLNTQETSVLLFFSND